MIENLENIEISRNRPQTKDGNLINSFLLDYLEYLDDRGILSRLSDYQVGAIALKFHHYGKLMLE